MFNWPLVSVLTEMPVIFQCQLFLKLIFCTSWQNIRFTFLARTLCYGKLNTGQTRPRHFHDTLATEFILSPMYCE